MKENIKTILLGFLGAFILALVICIAGAAIKISVDFYGVVEFCEECFLKILEMLK